MMKGDQAVWDRRWSFTSKPKHTMSATSGWLTQKQYNWLRIALFGLFCLFLGAVIVFLVFVFIVNPSGKTVEMEIHEETKLLTIEESRLPRHTQPMEYNLRLKTWLPGYGVFVPENKRLTFEGLVTISMMAHKETNEITLNSVGLNIKLEDCTATDAKGPIAVTDLNLDTFTEKATFKLNRTVTGPFSLSVQYSGRVDPDVLVGLYLTTYKNTNGEEKLAFTTQMESTDARRMVPCFDEPNWKAKWTVTIVHPKGTVAVSNGIEDGQPREVDGNFLETKFHATPPMSSYLLATLISDFTYIEGRTKKDVRFRIWSRPEAMSTTTYALDAGIRCLEGLEDYFGVEFPLKKQDMVAIPDFEVGAMENWGLITYREVNLLFDEPNYYYSNKQRVAQVVAHELSHMWFGNLATMKWWNDIWLNEGFASLVQNIGVDIISNGSFKMEDQFVDVHLARAMARDASRSSNPIITEATYQSEIAQFFSAIIYDKGASVLSMIQKLMGKENFKHGVSAYLRKFQYNNTHHSDLFAQLDSAVLTGTGGPDGKKLNVTEFALKWTLQMGFPYLTLVSHNQTHWVVEQERYLTNPEAKEKPKFANPKYEYQWDVPVWYQYGSGPVQLDWLPFKGKLFLTKTEESLILNADSYAMARTNYDAAGWKKILDALKTDNGLFSLRTKYRVVSDAFAMAAIGKGSYKTALNFKEYIVGEKFRLPWVAFFNEMRDIDIYFRGTENTKATYNFMKRLLQPLITLPVEEMVASIDSEEAYVDKGHLVDQWLNYCRVDEKNCSMKEIFEANFTAHCTGEGLQPSRCSRVHPAIRAQVYCFAVKTGNDQTFQRILSFYKTEPLQLERDKLLQSLTCTHKEKNIQWLLDQLGSSELIRSQDIATVYSLLARNEKAGPLLADHLMKNWQEIYQRSKENKSIIRRSIENLLGNIRTREELEKLKKFRVSSKYVDEYDAVFTKAEQEAQAKIDWLETYGKALVDLLEKKAD